MEHFHQHEATDCHKEATLQISGLNAPTVIEQLSTEGSKTTAEHRKILMKSLSSLRYLLRQGLAIRGHKEDNGNLLQLLKLRCEDCLELAKLSGEYMSHEIINEQIT